MKTINMIGEHARAVHDKKVVVTGGAGFIGSHLVDALVDDNKVKIIDNLATGRMANIAHLDETRVAVLRRGVEEGDLREEFEGYDYVFHQAALPSVPRSIRDPLATNEANVTGTLKVLHAAAASGVQKVVFASSSSVYGDTPTLPKREDMPVRPLSPYAVTKAAGEQYCTVFEELYGLHTVALRYFNVFGPRQDPQSQYAAVIPKFIAAILNDVSPVVYGDGLQSRDFTFVKQVVEANIRACESNKTGVFNIACGRSVTINQLIASINDIVGKDVEPRYVAPRPGDVKHSLADISRARELGYQPAGDFIRELAETIRWFEDGATRKN
ncbi:MAG: SDR family oxidoreductase [Halobacteriota archaeon]